MRCSLRDICIFVAAYEERSFTAAAQRENATQSGVSQHMRNLEDTLGVTLFIREHGGVVPTPAATNFYRSCLNVLRTYAQAREDVSRFANQEPGEVRIGLMPTMTARILSSALDAFLRVSPNVNVHVIEGYSAHLTHMVQAGELDCAIVPSLATVNGVRNRPFIQTPETLVSAASSGLRNLEPVRLDELGPLKLVLPDPANTRRQTVETYCATHGIEIDSIVQLDSMMGTLDFVAKSDWVAVLPAVMMDEDGHGGKLCVNPIIGPSLDLDLVMIEPIRKPVSEQTERFLSFLEDEALHVAHCWQNIRDGRLSKLAPVKLAAHA